ncbi:MAG: winged helix-turn-helix domain-containing protein [Firmicutes bacterium]|nr:winged helix-turn-helix domain-containing protein [Bacillota bacterium]
MPTGTTDQAVHAVPTPPTIASLAALIADPSRATILLALLGGQSLLASELARAARITPQTASAHLRKLVDGGLLVSHRVGRHHYFRLLSPEVAHVLESLSTIAPPQRVRSLRQSDEAKAMRCARTCYDHVAGELGVAIAERLLEQRWLLLRGDAYEVSATGIAALRRLGINVEDLLRGKRHFAKPCLDWSERKYHIGGALGAAIATKMFELAWIERVPASRAVKVTQVGKSALQAHLGLYANEIPT